MASVPMSDGSKITLNTDSQIRLAVSEKERHVELDQGEAFFEVVRDATRPFVVSAGSKRVIAVGTKFSVRRIGSDIRVFVAEGKVRVEDDSRASSFRLSRAPSISSPAQKEPHPQPLYTDAGNAEVLVAAGGIAHTGDAGIVVQENVEPQVEDHLSWRAGYLIFRETPLADAVAEFNRYNDEKIVIRDQHVAQIRFSGKIKPTSADAFLRLLEEAFPVRAERSGSQIVLADTLK